MRDFHFPSPPLLSVILLALSATTGLGLAGVSDQGRLVRGPVIVDDRWTKNPTLAVERVTGALTLQSGITDVEFLLLPAPGSDAMVNSVVDMKCLDGELHPGQGDLFNNQGPVDYVSYDPATGELVSQMAGVPEQQIGAWNLGASGRVYLAGWDSQENGFGNLFVHTALGWDKRRTIFPALHVDEIIEFRDSLFARYQATTFPVSYPFILRSEDRGASWQFEPLADVAVTSQFILDFDVTQGDTASLYAIARWLPTGGTAFVVRILRHDGQTWDEIEIDDPAGRFVPFELLEFGGTILVAGNVFDARSGGFLESAFYRLRGSQPAEIPFLRGRRVRWRSCAEKNGVLHCVEFPPVDQPDGPHVVHRSADLVDWKTTGQLALLPGVQIASLEFCRERLYVGGVNRGWTAVPDVEVFPVSLAPIEAASLVWEANVPARATLSFKIRTATSFLDLDASPWVGPDGTAGSSFTTSGEALHAQHAGDSLFQVKIFKTAAPDGSAPSVAWMRIVDTGGSVTIAVDEGTGVYAAVNSSEAGKVVSEVFRLREPVDRGSVFFDAEVPDGTTIVIQVRSGTSLEELSRAPFAGPDGDPRSHYDSDGQPLWSGHQGDTWIQYRALLNASVSTRSPFLKKVVLLTRRGVLDHFELDLPRPGSVGGKPDWQAGAPRPIRVVARDIDGHRVSVDGAVELVAVGADGVELAHPEPRELELHRAMGIASIALHDAVPTRVCAELAGVRSCSELIAVLPAAADALVLATDLLEPAPHWSPVARTGEPFELSIRAVDRFGNTATAYTGAVTCRLWQAFPADAPPLIAYTFAPADEGLRTFDAIGDLAGEYNVVCSGDADPGLAGTQTIRFESADRTSYRPSAPSRGGRSSGPGSPVSTKPAQ